MRRVLGHVVAAGFLAVAGLAASVGAALACEPYTFDDDGFGLERGIAWAFEGHVDQVIPGETGQGPAAVVIVVDRTLAGEAAGQELSIAQDDGCDAFHYGPGADVVVAVPRYPRFLAEPGPADRLKPPYANVTNYTVAVWVLDGERVVPGDGPHSWPIIGGVQPQTAADVKRALLAMPDTSTGVLATSASPGGPDDSWRLLLAVGLASSLLAASASGRRVRRGRP